MSCRAGSIRPLSSKRMRSSRPRTKLCTFSNHAHVSCVASYISRLTRRNMLHCRGLPLQDCTNAARLHSSGIAGGHGHTSFCVAGNVYRRCWPEPIHEVRVASCCTWRTGIITVALTYDFRMRRWPWISSEYNRPATTLLIYSPDRYLR
jgi:hypothetical protein